VAEDLLNTFNNILENKRKTIETEIDRMMDEILAKRKNEILYTKDKALKQIIQLLQGYR
jgi:vacuolar-type H+-ATPase subunit E/Vma4